MLYAQVIIAMIALASGNMEYQLLSDYQSGVYTSQEQAVADGLASDERQRLVAIIRLIVFVVSGALILRWIHRANYNVRQLGAENMKFSPGWSIGYYFIPVLALWKPYQAMREIWKASKEPSDWASQDASAILTLWWSLWLVSGLLGQAVFRLSSRAEDIEDLMTLNVVSQLSDGIGIPLALVLLGIVNRVHSMQCHQFSASTRMDPVAANAG